MNYGEVIYRLVFFIAFLFSFTVIKNKNRSLLVFPLLLFIGNIVELIVLLLKSKPYYPIVYHVYIPIEYMLLSYFYLQNLNSKRMKQFILFTIPLFFILCITISYRTIQPFIYPHPTLQFNIAGILLVVFALTSLFHIKEDMASSIYKNYLFWINIGILFFYSGNFLLMGTYNYLKQRDPDFATQLWSMFNTTLNVVLYIFFIIGFICSKPIRKF